MRSQDPQAGPLAQSQCIRNAEPPTKVPLRVASCTHLQTLRAFLEGVLAWAEGSFLPLEDGWRVLPKLVQTNATVRRILIPYWGPVHLRFWQSLARHLRKRSFALNYGQWTCLTLGEGLWRLAGLICSVRQPPRRHFTNILNGANVMTATWLPGFHFASSIWSISA